LSRCSSAPDIALILARIKRGLQLAAALEARLVRHPMREEAAPAPARAPPDRARRTAQRTRAAASPLALVPTAEEIAAALRHRPVGEVIADICRDLGIARSHPLWGEMLMVVTEFGGNFVKLFKDVQARVSLRFTDPTLTEDNWPVPLPQTAAACGTGPP